MFYFHEEEKIGYDQTHTTFLRILTKEYALDTEDLLQGLGVSLHESGGNY